MVYLRNLAINQACQLNIDQFKEENGDHGMEGYGRAPSQSGPSTSDPSIRYLLSAPLFRRPPTRAVENARRETLHKTLCKAIVACCSIPLQFSGKSLHPQKLH